MNLDELRQRFRERCWDDLEKIRSVPDPVAAIEHEEQKDLLIKLAHRISGSAGIFGFAQLSNAGNALETRLIEPSANLPEIEKAYDVLVDALEEVVSGTV